MNKTNIKKAKRIHILGISGSGKSYLAHKISNHLNINKYDLDDVFWRKKYTDFRSEKEKKELLSKIVANESWIVEGVFTSFVEESLKNADVVIWVDENMHLISFRIFRRSLSRELKKKKPIGLSWLRKTLDLIRFARRYKSDDGMYNKYLQMFEDYSITPLKLNGRREVNKFVKEYYYI